MDFNYTLPSDRPLEDNLNFNPMVRSLTNPLARPPKRHGTGVLDLLGDYIMEATGLGEIKKKRQLQNAMANYDQDPEGTIAAVTDIDPIYGMKLRDQINDNNRLAAAQTSIAEGRKDRTAYNDQILADRRRKTAASYLYPIVSDSKMTPEQKAQAYAAIRPRLLNAFPDNDYMKLSAELPENYDDISLSSFVGGGSTVAQQRNSDISEGRLEETRAYHDRTGDQRDRSLDQRDETIDIARQRANTYASKGGPSGRRKPVGRYVGDDGYYHVQFDDGSEQRSDVKVRANKGGRSVLDRFGASPSKGPDLSKYEGKVVKQNGRRFLIKNGKATPL